MDEHGYPDEGELDSIKKWPFNDFEGLIQYVSERWKYPEFGWKQTGRRYRLATGGWSGNEDLINAMNCNLIFWSQCWQSSHRGGLHIFKLPARRIK